MPGFVVGGCLLLIFREDERPPLFPHQHFIFGRLEVGHDDVLAVPAGGEQSRFVHEVRQIGARESRRPARQDRDIYVFGQRDLLGVDLQDAFTPADVGQRHHHAPVEAARSQQRRVEHIGAVGGGDQDDAFVRFEPVHFHQQLVERLLALVVPTAQSRAAMPAHGVNFVNENNARRVLLALFE